MVLKKIKDLDARDERKRRLFFKEAVILNDTNHRNIVKFLGLCPDPCSLMLEYLCFDFAPFDGDTTVSTLGHFLTCLNDNGLVDSFPFQLQIAAQVSSGLAYLHQANIAHRDLKPANVLVSDQYYCQRHQSFVNLLILAKVVAT